MRIEMTRLGKYLLRGIATLLAVASIAAYSSAQMLGDEIKFLEQLSGAGALPANILSSRTVVLHSFACSDKELETIQEYFQRSGIDAVAYYPIDMVVAGKDVAKVFSDQLIKREIANFAIVQKTDTDYRLTITSFNRKESLVDKGQSAWTLSNKTLTEALKSLQRSTSTGLNKTNLLINTLPEIGLTLDPIIGKRNEFYAVDMKVDLVAIPKFGDEALDKELEQIVTANFPFKFKLTDPGVSEKELRKQGMLYVMNMIHTRAKMAQELLGYNTAKSESAVVSVTYPDGQQQLRNIPANMPVYKVYFKHIDSGNVFLGTKWDADLTWQSALLNQIRGMKTELRLN
jgi:hypothetical protein